MTVPLLSCSPAPQSPERVRSWRYGADEGTARDPATVRQNRERRRPSRQPAGTTEPLPIADRVPPICAAACTRERADIVVNPLSICLRRRSGEKNYCCNTVSYILFESIDFVCVKERGHRALASSRSNAYPWGMGQARARIRSTARARRSSFAIVMRFVEADTISSSSPGFRPRSSTSALGSRTARLLPHLETCTIYSEISRDTGYPIHRSTRRSRQKPAGGNGRFAQRPCRSDAKSRHDPNDQGAQPILPINPTHRAPWPAGAFGSSHSRVGSMSARARSADQRHRRCRGTAASAAQLPRSGWCL